MVAPDGACGKSDDGSEAEAHHVKVRQATRLRAAFDYTTAIFLSLSSEWDRCHFAVPYAFCLLSPDKGTVRLLQQHDTCAFSLTKDLVGDDTIPPYAILSHSWDDGQEITFQYLVECTGGGKSGYNKLWFCAAQAKLDSLQYFWVDTCCIDKSNQCRTFARDQCHILPVP
jgi:hypothetical protein